ncbi:hypothetical protein L218DRAFT_895138 [Marasmius fiardii PR-910]|nr:hypothetical protein L218DRAFT_895138 [Marasmius fiardii PR-910]
MNFYPFEITAPHIIYACLGGFVVLFGMFSLFLREKLYVGEACWAFIFGIIIGPYCANIFDPRGWGRGNDDVTNAVTLEFTRIVLAIGVFAIGVELPKAYMKKHWKSLFYLLGPVMTYGWFVSAGFIYALVPGLNFLQSLAVAACLTPTDPILAQAVVGGKYADKHVPAHLRHLLAAESGCNDGAAFPFLFIALYIIIERDVGFAIRDWFLYLWLYQVVLGIVIGAVVGIGFRYLMKYCEKWGLINRHSYVAQYISLSLFTVGVTVLLGSDDLLSTFACGTAFAWDGFFNRQTEETVFSSVIDLLFNVACFVFIGAWMPFSSFSDPELTLTVWRLIVIAILVLLFRRLPVVLVLYKWIPDIKTFREAVFTGHFGPIGVGAVFISTLASEVLHKNAHPDDPQAEFLRKTIQPIIAFMVLCSIVIHGLSIPGFSLGRRVHSVTRTWSRHTGGTHNAPDWTNQATIVTDRGEIVVNRDDHHARDMVDEMERGQLTPVEKSSMYEKRSDEKVESEEEEPHHPSDKGEVLPEGEEPPDGEEIVSEWQEGPHRVIERRKGPGEEVEVEVIRNFGSSEAHSSLFHGTHESTRARVGAYVNHLKQLMEAQEKGMEKESARLESKLKEIVHVTTPHSPPYKPKPELHAALNDSDQEDEWASEDDVPSTSTAASTSDGRGRSKSPRMTSSTSSRRAVQTNRSVKRKGSNRSGRVTHRAEHRSSTAKTTEGDGRRGRSISPVAVGTVSAPEGEGVARSGSRLRKLRLNEIRTHSPARSVRWVDEGRPDTPKQMSGSPRTPTGSSTPTVEAEIGR